MINKILRTILGMPFVIIIWLLSFAVSLIIFSMGASMEWIFEGQVDSTFAEWINDTVFNAFTEINNKTVKLNLIKLNLIV